MCGDALLSPDAGDGHKGPQRPVLYPQFQGTHLYSRTQGTATKNYPRLFYTRDVRGTRFCPLTQGTATKNCPRLFYTRDVRGKGAACAPEPCARQIAGKTIRRRCFRIAAGRSLPSEALTFALVSRLSVGWEITLEKAVSQNSEPWLLPCCVRKQAFF